MAKNRGNGKCRKGPIKGRTQFSHNGTWYKRDSSNGQIVDCKADGKPFKSVPKES